MCTPSLRRNYPVQVLRVCSQPSIQKAPRGNFLHKNKGELFDIAVTFF